MKNNTILRLFVIGGIFLLPALTPWIVSSSLFFPFITGKAYFFRVLTELVFGAWLILAYRDPRFRPRWSLVMWAVVAFVAIIGLADFFGANPYRSFWSNYERMEGFITLLHLLGYFLVAGSVLTKEKLWYWFFGVSVASSMLMDVFAFFQLAGKFPINQGGVRVDGKFGNAAYLAVYNLFHIFLAAFLLLRMPAANLIEGFKKKRSTNMLAGGLGVLAIIFNGIVLYHTATRGAILGLIAGVLVALVLIALFEKKNKKLARGALGAIVVTIALVFVFIGAKNTAFVQQSPVLSRFASISFTDKTTESRFMVWNMALDGFKERPILGWGQENFIRVFSKYYNPLMYNQEPWFDRAHNVVLDWLIAGGLLGVLSYLALFVSALYLLWFKLKKFSVAEKSVLTGLFVAYFSHNLFVFDNMVSYILFFSLLAYLHQETEMKSGFVALEKKVLGFFRHTKDAFPEYVVIPIIIVLTATSLYVVNFPSAAANANLLASLQPQKDIATNLSYIKKALAYQSFGNMEIAERLSITTYSVINASSIDNKDKQSFVSAAEQALTDEVKSDPNNVRELLFLGTFLDRIGWYKQALPHLEKAAELSPMKQAVLFELGNAYIGNNDIDKALEVLKRAYDLAPAYDNARIAYAAALIRNGNDKLADTLLAPLSDSGPVSDPQIISAYIATKQTSKVVSIYGQLVKKNPTDSQAHILLASAYLQNGQRTKAIAELQKVIELRPEFKKQGEYYISEIRAGRNP